MMHYEVTNARYLFSCQGPKRRRKKRPKSPSKDPRSSLPRHKVKKSPEVLKGQRVIGRNKVDGFYYAGMSHVLIAHKCMYHSKIIIHNMIQIVGLYHGKYNTWSKMLGYTMAHP